MVQALEALLGYRSMKKVAERTIGKGRVHVEAEFAPAEFFGRSDLRMNRLVQHLFELGVIEDVTDAAFARAINRRPSTVRRWRTYHSFPNSVSLVLMAKKFNVDINWIVGLRGNAIEDAFSSATPKAAKVAERKAA